MLEMYGLWLSTGSLSEFKVLKETLFLSHLDDLSVLIILHLRR